MRPLVVYFLLWSLAAGADPRPVKLVIDSPNPSKIVSGYQLAMKADPADPHKVTITLSRYNTGKKAQSCLSYDNESVFVETGGGPFGRYMHPENRDPGKPRLVPPGKLISQLRILWSPLPEDQPTQKFALKVHKLQFHHGGKSEHKGGVTGGVINGPTLKFHYAWK